MKKKPRKQTTAKPRTIPVTVPLHATLREVGDVLRRTASVIDLQAFQARTLSQPQKGPRIITVTVARLRRIARLIDRGDEYKALADDILDWAAELDDYDARETRLDPSKRRGGK